MERRPRSQDRDEDGDCWGSRRRKHSGKTLQERTELAVVETLGARTRTSSTNNRFVTLGRAVKNEARTEKCLQWTYTSRDFSAFKERIVFVSYNILGVDNTAKHQDLYYHVRPEFLKWRRRKRLITREIKDYHASIICFQEVDCFDDLAILLRKYGFTGIYKARTGEANDGCAIFWKEKHFGLTLDKQQKSFWTQIYYVHQENLEFKTFGLRDNVTQLCILKINLLLEKAHELSENWGPIPAVLGGDLNGVPQSAIYELLASTELDVQLHNRKDICKKVEDASFSRVVGHYKTRMLMSPATETQLRIHPFSEIFGFQCVATSRWVCWSSEELRLAMGHEQISHLRHPWKLFSAYMVVPGSSRTRDDFGETLVTSYHSKFMGTVDYIWHNEELVPVRVLETLPVNILKRLRGLPNKKWGSDHLTLVYELVLVD